MSYGDYNPRKAPEWMDGAEGDDDVNNAYIPTDAVRVRKVDIAPGERLGDFVRRIYGSNTNINRQRVLAANGGEFPQEGMVNVPV